MKLKPLIQAILLLASGGFAIDLKNTGVDVESPATWGNVAGLLAGVGAALGLSRDWFSGISAKLLSCLASGGKCESEDLPARSRDSLSWIALGLRSGVDPASLKSEYDAQWPLIVEHCRAKEAANDA